jgi:SSS family solute:Na+ symporter/sodium/proline symporter
MKIAVLVLYALMMVAVIFFTAKKSISLNDFLLGGRRVGPWMSALSYGTAYFSAVIIVGYAGSVGWRTGLSSVWAGIGNALVGGLLAWALLAKPTRLMGERLGVATVPSFLEKRYQSKPLKIVSSLIIFVFLLPYSASVYKGLGIMFQKAMGFDYTWCVIGIALLSSVYLFLGGYKATAVSDFIQGLIMLAGIFAVVFYILRGAGGVSAGLAELGKEAIGGPGYNSLFPPKGQEVFLISNVVLTSFGVLGMPHMIHKFFAIRETAAIKRATIISTLFCLIIAGGAYFAGSFGRVIFNKLGTSPAAPDQIMPTILVDQNVVGMPDAFLGLVVVLLLSASISTLTALVLSSSSVLSIDLLGTLFPKMGAKRTTLTMRLLCVAFVVFSLAINFLLQNTPIVSLMSLSWGTISGAFLAPFLYGLLWKGVTKAGVYAGVICGALTSLLPPLITGDFSLAPVSGACAMGVGLILVPLVSILTKKWGFSGEHIAMVFGKKEQNTQEASVSANT